MITLAFRPLRSESTILVRATYFRICADRTLRGPDNAVTASYTEGLWQLANRQHRAFECNGPVYLRVTGTGSQRECKGPYEFIKAAEGAIFTHAACLGFHVGRTQSFPDELWQEVVLLRAV